MRSHTEQKLYYDGLHEGHAIKDEVVHTIDRAIYHAVKDVPESRANLVIPAKLILRNAYHTVISEITQQVTHKRSLEYTLAAIVARVSELLMTEAEALQIHGNIPAIIEFITTHDLILATGIQLSPYFHRTFPHNFKAEIEVSLTKTTAFPPHSYLQFLRTRNVISEDTDEAKAA